MAKITFEVNGKTYEAKEIGFNDVCTFEEHGVPMEKMGDMGMSMIRAYLCMCGDMDTVEAGKEIEAHVIDGGGLEDISAALGKRISESGFFRALSKGQKKETTKRTSKKTEETE